MALTNNNSIAILYNPILKKYYSPLLGKYSFSDLGLKLARNSYFTLQLNEWNLFASNLKDSNYLMNLGKLNVGLEIGAPSLGLQSTLGAKSAKSGAWGKGGSGWAAVGAATNALGSVNTGDPRGMWDTMDPIYHLADGKESTVGNALSDTGVSLTQAGLSSGNYYLALAGAAAKIFGGLTNAAFGVKENKKNVEYIKNNTSLARKVGSGFGKVSTSDELLSAAGRMTGGSGFKWGDLYENGWFTSAGTEKGNKLIGLENSALAYQNNALGTGALSVDKTLDDNTMANFTAFGGPIDVNPSTPIGYSIYTDRFVKDKLRGGSGMTNMFAGTPDIFGFGGGIYTKGANFDTGVSFINKGGTHELNPNDGVPMGVDSLGVPNLVEEGEVRWGDYMFSDRLIVPRGKRGNYGKRVRKYAEGGRLAKGKGIDTPYESKVLKPYEGLTFADAAKKILKRNGADERDDAITMRGIDAELSVLTGIQEKEREKEKLREIQETIDNMSPEEFAMLQLQMEAQLAALQQQEMAMQLQLMIPEGMELMVPQEQRAAAYGGPIYELGGLLNNWDIPSTSLDANVFADGGFKDWWEKYINDPVMVNTATDGTDNRLINPDYGALYRTFTGKDDLKLSGEVYNALLKLYETNPEKFTAYDFRTNTFVNSPEKVTNSEETTASPELEVVLKGEVKGPELLAFNYYNSRHSDKPLTAEQWNTLGEKEKGRYIKQYKSTLGKDDKIAFDESLTAYNKQQELNDKVAKYQKQQREPTLTADDIKDLSYEDKVRLAKYMNPDYQAQDLSKLSLNERDEAKKALDEQLVLMSKDKGVTLDNLSKNFAAPQYHRDWKPVDAEQAWLENTTGYNWQNPLYGGEHDVVAGNTEGKYQPRSWVNDEGKVVINDGDNTYTYDDLKAYELSDEYLKPRYELAKSAAAQDEAGLKIWNDYVNGLSLDYTASYVPTTVFGENYADNLGNYEDFKDYITSNYDALNQAGSGFFDLKAGQMHGMMLPTTSRQRELYQIKGNEGTYLTPEGNWLDYYTDSITDDNKGTILHTLTPRGGIAFTRVNGTPEDIEVRPDGTYVVKGSEEKDPFPRAASWPYAVAAGLQLGSLGYNILKPADYSNADALLNASKDAGLYKPVEFRPIGNYLPYKPLDIWYELNRLNANARATDRAILNSGANLGSKAAALLASGYNNLLASGNLYRQNLEYNDALRKQVTDFNRGTDMFNSEGFLKADMANQDAATRAAGYTLEGKRAAYAMRQAIDDAKANAISAGLSGLGNLAMAYGLNKWNLDVLGWKLRHNQYPISLLEGYKYDPYTGKPVSASKGGKLRTRRKRSLSF